MTKLLTMTTTHKFPPQDDVICREEAQFQFLRDKRVEGAMIVLLRNRFDDCVFYEKGTGQAAWGEPRYGPAVDVGEGSEHICKKVWDTFDRASTNYWIKYGELGYQPRVEQAFAKQKHRLMWERRHGEIGSGMKSEESS